MIAISGKPGAGVDETKPVAEIPSRCPGTTTVSSIVTEAPEPPGSTNVPGVAEATGASIRNASSAARAARLRRRDFGVMRVGMGSSVLRPRQQASRPENASGYLTVIARVIVCVTPAGVGIASVAVYFARLRLAEMVIVALPVLLVVLALPRSVF